MGATTAEERLCSRRWRILHSWWLVVPIISLGALNFLPFLVNGIRARRVSWLVISGVFAAAFTFYIVALSGIDTGTKASPKNNFVGGYLVLNWLVGIIVTIATNRSRLRWRAAKNDRAWYHNGVAGVATASTAERPINLDGVFDGRAEPRGAAGSAAPRPLADESASGHQIDVNLSSASELSSELHLSPQAAAQIAAARTRLDGFRSADQLMTEGGLPPHVFMAIRDRVIVSADATSSASPSPSPSPSGSGRRLEF